MSPAPSLVSGAIPASIFLILSLACFYLMDIVSLIIKFPSPTASGFFEWDNGTLPILDNFHWLRPLDPVIREITPGFAPSSFGYDDFGGGGVIVPVYYFAYLAFTPPTRSQPLSERKIDIHGAIIWSVLVVLFHVIPVVGIMFDTTLEDRHWWTWFWQLYSVRITLSWYIIRFFGWFITLPTLHSTLSYRTKTTLILAPFIAIALGFWTYTALYCPYSLSMIFFPYSLAVDTWVSRMRRLLQFDQLFIFGSSVLWVAMDMRRNGSSSAIKILFAAVVLAGVVGTGASFGLVWLWREWQLVSDGEKDTSKTE
ncbi:uncharacterized protein N0V89_007572 [Didymosphaeria variabile]|uniref:Uncharacterized protein n=1 Tax=Didymosphaeria variabile TaxID=1932322 RepID=A0A9W9CAB4_9PLEO|nr:uncharacterized protein N0V89_007572 [Didymosphaeria variabile]KAJ4352225.1 hypothetical protein N0V89_007572 [Didymosphaeria variabile]